MKTLTEALRQAGVDTRSVSPFAVIDGETIYCLPVGVDEAIRTWVKLREWVPQTGYWPVILGNAGEEPQPREMHKYDRVTWEPAKALTTFDILEEVALTDVQDLFQGEQLSECEVIAEQIEDARLDGNEDEIHTLEAMLAQEPPFRGLPLRSNWPEGLPSAPLSTGPTWTPLVHRSPHPVSVGLVPTPHGWEVPAFVRFGAVNACPHPVEFGAVLKHWNTLYGAEVVSLTSHLSHFTLDIWATRPPTTRAAALALAREQYLWCYRHWNWQCKEPGSLEEAAEALMRTRSWWFSWD